MEIFEFNYKQSKEKEWVYAQDIFEAMQLYASEHCVECESMDENIEIRKLRHEEWDTHKVTNDEYDAEDPNLNWEKQTFREFTEGATTSHYIAGTMND